MLRIGIVAVSAEGAALCYRTLCQEAASVAGLEPHAHPEIALHGHSLADYETALAASRWDVVAELLRDSARRLLSAGAELLICPDNTVHPAVDAVRAELPVPWLHIAEQVADAARARGLRRLGILGTRLLMESDVYPTRLRPLAIGWEIPPPAARERIDRHIFEDLVAGRFPEAGRRVLEGAVQDLARRGCDGIVLGCTELPLALPAEACALPAIDSTRTLARAALRRAAGGA